jgi:hypothetical protein
VAGGVGGAGRQLCYSPFAWELLVNYFLALSACHLNLHMVPLSSPDKLQSAVFPSPTGSPKTPRQGLGSRLSESRLSSERVSSSDTAFLNSTHKVSILPFVSVSFSPILAAEVLNLPRVLRSSASLFKASFDHNELF